MATRRETGRNKLATKVYKYEVGKTFNVTTCTTDLQKLYLKLMILEVLEWNDTADYLTDSEITCLESVLNINNC